MNNTLNEFRKFLLVRRGLQLITAKGYTDSIRRMENKLGKEPSNFQIEEYIYEMYTSNYSYSHKTNTALAVERYTEFLKRPLKLGRQKKPKTIIKDTLTEAEVTRIIFCCKDLKEKAIISLLAYSGLRNKEMCNLKVKDFDSGRNEIRVIQGKGLKDGVSEISASCSKILQQYIQEFGLSEEDFIFWTYQGNQYTGGALRKRVKVISTKAKIVKRVYPHLFRHSLAVNLLIRGADIATLKNQLRHSLLETTLHYLNSIILKNHGTYSKFQPSYL